MTTKLMSKQSPIHLLIQYANRYNDDHNRQVTNQLTLVQTKPLGACNITLLLLYHIPMVPSMLPTSLPSNLLPLPTMHMTHKGQYEPFHMSKTGSSMCCFQLGFA